MVASKYTKKYINKYNTTKNKEKKKKTLYYITLYPSTQNDQIRHGR